MDAKVALDGGMQFTGTSDTGYSVVMDSSEAVGGSDNGFRPMELLLVGLCGCTAMDVISILRKKRQTVVNLEVKAHATQADGYPHVFTAIELEYLVSGSAVDPNAVERAIQLSAERYCPAQAMFSQVADITTRYKIFEVGN